jgi:hypothetical protein
VAPEDEGTSPRSQQPANGPYAEPGESTPHPLNHSPQDPFWYHPPTYALVFQVVFSPRAIIIIIIIKIEPLAEVLKQSTCLLLLYII